MAGCAGASAHGLPITGINNVNVCCVTCFENKVYKTKKRLTCLPAARAVSWVTWLITFMNTAL